MITTETSVEFSRDLERFSKSDFCVLQTAAEIGQKLMKLRQDLLLGSLFHHVETLEISIKELMELLDDAETEAEKITTENSDLEYERDQIRDALQSIYYEAERAI